MGSYIMNGYMYLNIPPAVSQLMWFSIGFIVIVSILGIYSSKVVCAYVCFDFSVAFT